MDEVALIDANILAVILARINIFIAISDLIEKDEKIFIPAYIGDSTVADSDKIDESDNKYAYKFYVDTEVIELKIPMSFLDSSDKFIEVMQDIEAYVQHHAKDRICDKLKELCSDDDESIFEIANTFELLEKNELLNASVLNSITNYFIVCNLGRFDLIVGNPPWVDWKNLPSVHREKIKNSCISRNLFSGDNRTGGINLNICALLSNIAAENWLNKDGVMALLMPQYILFQQSYDGYRKLILKNGENLFLQEIVDWSKSGHPFSPVQQLFATYVMSKRKQDYFKGIPAKSILLKKSLKLENINNCITEDNFSNYFITNEFLLAQTTDKRTAFSYVSDYNELKAFQKISGEADYIGREGVEFYPQEVQLLKIIDIKRGQGLVEVETYQNSRSKYSIPKRKAVLEVKYLRPLIKGIYIRRFHLEKPEYIVAFPYNRNNYKIPIPALKLREESRFLYQYYLNNKQYLDMQNKYSDKIINDGDAEYYALARTGIYSHAPWYVVFRDNTKWVSTVVGAIETEWGGLKLPSFQNHCVSICENSNKEFITEDEAHYICAILNSHVVEKFIYATSDKRTFKIRLPFKVMQFDRENEIHLQLMKLSKKAHNEYNDIESVENIRNEIDMLYLRTLD